MHTTRGDCSVPAEPLTFASCSPRVWQRSIPPLSPRSRPSTANSSSVGSLRHPFSNPAKSREEGWCLDPVPATAEFWPQPRQEVVQVSSKQPAELKHQHARAIHNKANQNHGIRHQLSRNCNEEEVCLHAPLILATGIRKGQNEPLKVVARVGANECICSL